MHTIYSSYNINSYCSIFIQDEAITLQLFNNVALHDSVVEAGIQENFHLEYAFWNDVIYRLQGIFQ